MATEKNVNYTDAQVKLIEAAVAANGGRGNLSVAETLARNPEMNDSAGHQRKARAIVAKMSRMNVPYDRKVAVSKNGKPVSKKSDLVARIATLAGVSVESLSGLDSAPKLTLDTLVEALTGTDG